mgnify:CR=1 FL=1|tara:strand:- start:10000 stop:10581 length:582 start_codon:yes stop_codon:yes gene_type:complete
MEPLMIAILVGFLLIISVLSYYLFSKKESFSSCGDHMKKDEEVENYTNVEQSVPACVGDMVRENFDPVPSDPMTGNETNKELMDNDEDPIKGNLVPTDCYPKDSLKPEDLLPTNKATSWSKANPSGSGKLNDQNFLHAGYHVGINTVGQSLRNANLQLRSEPANPTKKVGPWMQSTIEPDLNRLPLEIHQGSQ